MPSASITRVSVRRASSSSLDRSAEERARRETSRPKMAPTSPRHTRATTSLNPARLSAERPDNPRSASMTSMALAAQPSRAASSTRPYWRAVDSVLSRTWAREDWRTYTNPKRLRCDGVIFTCPRTTRSLLLGDVLDVQPHAISGGTGGLRHCFLLPCFFRSGCRRPMRAGQGGLDHVGDGRHHLRQGHGLVQLPAGQQLHVDCR